MLVILPSDFSQCMFSIPPASFNSSIGSGFWIPTIIIFIPLFCSSWILLRVEAACPKCCFAFVKSTSTCHENKRKTCVITVHPNTEITKTQTILSRVKTSFVYSEVSINVITLQCMGLPSIFPSLGSCLYGGGGPHVGEVTRLVGTTRLTKLIPHHNLIQFTW